jgi:hypothetical protein
MSDNKIEISKGMGKRMSGDGMSYSPICHQCKNWNEDLTCKAFPDGIPLGILTGTIDHTKAVDGDNDIQFEQK